MNNINSLILEGKILEIKDNGCFIETVRYEKQTDGKLKDYKTKVFVVCNSFLERFDNAFEVGRGARFVGRLAQTKHGLGVFCEHVEFKPKLDA